MSQFRCSNDARRLKVLKLLADGKPAPNGIDFLEVLDSRDMREEERQRTLELHLMYGLSDEEQLKIENIAIEGGERVTDVIVTGVKVKKDDDDQVIIIKVNKPGDFSSYVLKLVKGPRRPQPPDGFDPILSEVGFSFKAECPTDFDCFQPAVMPQELQPEPPIDYLAKDYSSFRQLMLDRLSVTMPAWKERSPADLGIALVELLAYAGDYLSYYQDAVATEAYLGTARRKISVKRHARILDYFMNEGVNARVWVCLEWNPVVPEGTIKKENIKFLTRFNTPDVVIKSDQFGEGMRQGARVFEPVHDIKLSHKHNRIEFHTWGDDRCYLPRGATSAALCGDPGLKAGDVLLFEELLGPESGLEMDANPAHRHAVRLSATPRVKEDPLEKCQVTEIEWFIEDALPFPLCLWRLDDDSAGSVPAGGSECRPKRPVSVARGNVVLADHGRTIKDDEEEELIPARVPEDGDYNPRLRRKVITHTVSYDNELARRKPAFRAALQKVRDAKPVVFLENGEKWSAEKDLLKSGRFAREFVVEAENDGGVYLRFGDDVHGMRPAAGAKFNIEYRVGCGRNGNVGANTISHVVTDTVGITSVYNPLPAEGGADPETIEQTKLYAPRAFHDQERAVTVEDYAAVAQRYHAVQKAVATLRWTGSWHTVFITVDRKGGWPVDDGLRAELRSFVERFRLAGHDVEIDSPRFISLDISMTVKVSPGYLRGTVKAVLLETFSNADLGEGRRGFFHPDMFTFGQPVYLSKVIGAAVKVHGVEWVSVDRFHRWGQPPERELEDGRITFGRLEIARLDNDVNALENGRLELNMVCGL